MHSSVACLHKHLHKAVLQVIIAALEVFSLYAPMTKKLLLDAAILLALAIMGIVGYKLAPLFNPKTDIALPMSGCDLAKQACVATLPDGGQLEFSIDPRPIPALKPLKLQASTKGSDVRKIEVDFAGTEMKMGYNRPLLTNDGAQNGQSGRFSGQGVLPICITGTMAYDVTVLVETSKALVAVPFRINITGE
jgi:hypothetical protein